MLVDVVSPLFVREVEVLLLLPCMRGGGTLLSPSPMPVDGGPGGWLTHRCKLDERTERERGGGGRRRDKQARGWRAGWDRESIAQGGGGEGAAPLVTHLSRSSG